MKFRGWGDALGRAAVCILVPHKAVCMGTSRPQVPVFCFRQSMLPAASVQLYLGWTKEIPVL